MTHGESRLASLDVCRGMAVAGMILVNNPGNWGSTFEWITHADWNGCTLADLVFPTFIFILGAAMPLAFARRADDSASDASRGLRLLRRSAWLVLLGLMLNVVASAPHVVSMRWPGVLQRIGLVYLFAAPIVIRARPRWRLAIVAVLVLGHWALLSAHMAGASGLTREHNLAGAVDVAVFGRHLLTPTGDPEGLLGTIPAVGSALLGSLAGDWLRRRQAERTRSAGLIAAGLGLIATGALWSTVLPLNKALWTGSFVLVTSGIASLLLAACHHLVDVGGRVRWARPFVWLGFNALSIYFLAELVGHLLDAPWPADAAQPMTLRAWAFWSVMRPLGGDVADEWLSLLFAILAVAWWTAVAGSLYRRRIRIRV